MVGLVFVQGTCTSRTRVTGVGPYNAADAFSIYIGDSKSMNRRAAFREMHPQQLAHRDTQRALNDSDVLIALAEILKRSA